MKSTVIDLSVMLHHRTDKAVLVSDDGDKASAVWVPLSQVEIDDDAMPGETVEIVIPEWLAQERGLI